MQPGILSVPELCHHIAEAWVSGAVLTSSMVQYKRHNPGKVRTTDNIFLKNVYEISHIVEIIQREIRLFSSLIILKLDTTVNSIKPFLFWLTLDTCTIVNMHCWC